MSRRRARSPSLAKLEARVQAASQWLNVELEARVSNAEELRISVITALITGSVTSHIMRGLTPIMESF